MPKVNPEDFQKVKEAFDKYLTENNFRKTPERYTILEEIYSTDVHFNVEWLYERMRARKYPVSRATLYNTIEVLLNAKLIRKHQFGEQQTYYEKSFFSKQHDHILLSDTGEVIEFCDPSIQSIKKKLEEIFDIEIESHSLYFYAKRKEKK